MILSLVLTLLMMSFVSRMTYNKPVDANVAESEKITTQEVIQLNVLNGCGISGLATKSKDFLRARGFDVVEVGNSEQQYNKTTIIDRLGDKQSVQKLAYAIGVNDSAIVTQIDSSLFLRATLILGNDYKVLKPFN